jgi:hypothetical protein
VHNETLSVVATIIEVRPFRNGWQVYESPGVQTVFLNREDAIDYASGRASFRAGEIRILDSSGAVARIIVFNRQIERCAGNGFLIDNNGRKAVKCA